MNEKKLISEKIEKHRALYFQIGLCLSLGMSLLAFEWQSPKGDLVWEKSFEQNEFVELQMPIIRTKEPIKAPAVSNNIKAVENTFEPNPDPKPNPQPKKSDSIAITTIVLKPEVIDPEPFIKVPEIAASFPGGELALLNYLNQNIKYPSEAKRNNITGLVYVCFEVSSKGKIEKAEVVRGIGGGCDEVALTSVNNMPDWNPAMQGGKTVRTQMCLPVNFSLK
ncbi:MAG TPA: energy transducer TonB [Bacteroidia bacterium]|nr:energy transducer TonB [Bacteroidia bacterium]HNT79120.1 energy transducer TonB [Bacteroidia bacterium]